MRRRTLVLETAERIALEEMRDHHPKPYLRERAAALLKIASGKPPRQVANNGLLKPRKADTVYAWLNAYLENGIAGLYQRPRRKRRFSP